MCQCESYALMEHTAAVRHHSSMFTRSTHTMAFMLRLLPEVDSLREMTLNLTNIAVQRMLFEHVSQLMRR